MSDTFTIGRDLVVRRLGFGAMRITGDGIWSRHDGFAAGARGRSAA
jgi:pyridoxine 4-dehydrogenase